MLIDDLRNALYGATRSIEDTGQQPVLSVVIDTEEEFDWSQPHSRAETQTTALKHIESVQEIFDRYGVKPCYVVDYPVAVNTHDHQMLKQIHADERCVIGTHLHPWVTPPYTEEVSAYNSFPGNLSRDLEYEKLKVVTDAIAQSFDDVPRVYKAGRYGVGPNTRGILEDLGYEIELSPTPGYDYSEEGGPDFSRYSNVPFWFGAEGNRFCLPCTGGFVGVLGSNAPGVYSLVTEKLGERLRIPGIMARLGLLERIRLSPEGFTLTELKRITRFLISSGVRYLTLSFHSPSVVPGFTPYVRNDSELKEFLSKIDEYLEFFRSETAGEFKDPVEIRNLLSEH